MIKSHLLYQLSYAPGTGPESLRKRASFSKATSPMSSKATGFSRSSRPLEESTKKPPESAAFPYRAPCGEDLGSEALRSAAVTMIPVAVVTAILSRRRVRDRSRRWRHPPPNRAFHTRQDRQAAFLALVEGLVKRVGRVRDLLQGRR